MSAGPLLDPSALQRLTEYAAAWTGFAPDAILPDAIRRAAQSLGGTPEDLVARAAVRERAVVHVLCQAVSVGETFFFRHPDQFRWIASEFVPEMLASKRSELRAWSAGCATGEEAYSLAACLLEAMPQNATVDVLGTDLLERNLQVARQGAYGAWSRRPSGPELHPVLREGKSGKMAVNDRVRRVTRFELHNLLDGGARGPFDLILCRNVLVYFSPGAVRTVVAHLLEALAPGGALLFGPMDVPETPPGLSWCGAPELQIFRRTKAGAMREHRASPEHRAPMPAPRPAPPEPVALHVRALVHIERGEKVVAQRALADLCALVPDYVPGILERALLHIRQGERACAAQLMREVVRRTDGLPLDDELPGPEPLPVRFYRESASTFLRGVRGGR
jgi:chemotaxis protein methyltransferase CheR